MCVCVCVCVCKVHWWTWRQDAWLDYLTLTDQAVRTFTGTPAVPGAQCYLEHVGISVTTIMAIGQQTFQKKNVKKTPVFKSKLKANVESALKHSQAGVTWWPLSILCKLNLLIGLYNMHNQIMQYTSDLCWILKSTKALTITWPRDPTFNLIKTHLFAIAKRCDHDVKLLLRPLCFSKSSIGQRYIALSDYAYYTDLLEGSIYIVLTEVIMWLLLVNA